MKKPLFLLMLFAISMASVAQLPPISHLDINNVNATILGDGSILTPQQYDSWSGESRPCPAWAVPAGTSKETIYQHALWVGGLYEDTLHFAGIRYRQDGQDFGMGPLKTVDATTDFFTAVKHHHVWNLTRAEIEQFIANHGNSGYQIPADILTWPAHGDPGYAESLAPFVDVNNDGRYNPADGDYPDIKGDQCLFFIFNDRFNAHTETQSESIGLEVHGMVYGFDAPDDEALNNTVFMHYKFINRSGNDYDSTYIGLWTDWDLGYMNDDYVGCDVQHNACYAYNGLNYDGSGEPNAYDSIIPAQVVAVLNSPDDLGMTGFMFFSNGYGPMGDPRYGEDCYNYMQSRWLDGNHLQFGGDGYPHYGVGSECNYMYPGNTDPDHPDLNWTESEAGNMPGDRRGLASVGPFSFPAGDVRELDYAMITVWGPEGETGAMAPVSRIGEFVEHIKALFDNGFAK
jgi:hypothetical protein